MRYVIVGGSAAAISAVETIRSIDKRSPIDLFSDEKTPLFSRVLLPYYVAEELSKPLLNFRSLDFFDENNITAHIGEKVTAVSPEAKTVTTDKGESFPFDKLLLATGGRAIVPKIAGVEKEGISTLKTMADADRVYQMKGKKAVVIGAGSIGVESCISLLRRGMKVTLLEQLGQVLPTVFDEESASIIQGVVEGMGVEVLTGERATGFTGNGRVTGVVTGAREIDCDMVVLAVGIRPNIELARAPTLQALTDAPRVMLGGSAAAPVWSDYRLDLTDPGLARCSLWLDSELLYKDDRLYFMAVCVPFEGATRRSDLSEYSVFELSMRDEDFGKPRYLGALMTGEDAARLGAEELSKGNLTYARDGTLLFLTAPVFRGERFEEYPGCFVFEVVSIDRPQLRRDAAGAPLARVVVRSSDAVPSSASCVYHADSAAGIVLTRRVMDVEKRSFEWSLHATGDHP